MNIDWDGVRWFLAAVDGGSLSEAARRLHVDQSTVSRRISELESALGGPVFLRSRAGLTLTERGEAILPLAREAGDRLVELAEVSRDDRVAGTVRIALTGPVATYVVAPRVPILRARYPELRVELVTSSRIADLSRREADLALRFARPQRGDLVARRIADVTFSVRARADVAGLPWEELPWLAMDYGPVPAPEQDWARAHRASEPVLTVRDHGTFVAALRAGVGAGVLADRVAAEEGLSRVPGPEVDVRLPLWLVAHRASRGTPRVAAAWDWLAGT